MRFKVSKTSLDASTREEILNVAQKVFAEIGFKEATVRQICKAAKANVCLISYYFGGKDGLYNAVFDRAARMRLEMMKTLLGDISTSGSKEEYLLRLHLIIESMYKEIISKPDFFKLTHREMIDGMPRAAAIIKNYFGSIHQMLSDFVELGQKLKYLKKDINPDVATVCFISMLTGAIEKQIINADFFYNGINPKEIPDIVLKTVFQIFFEGVVE